MAIGGFISTSFPTDLASNFDQTALTLNSAPAQNAINYALKNTIYTPISGHPNVTPPGHRFTGSDLGYQHFTFILRSNLGGSAVFEQVTLNINPEDLSIDSPYRVNAVNTMGGAFVDVWGQGVRRILMRGHTGWKTYKSTGQVQDGYDNIFNLRDNIINRYLQIRIDNSPNYPQSRIDDGLSLELVDNLHQTVYSIIPENFRLLRNRARPLLHMYEATFVIRDLNPKDSTVNMLIDKTDSSIANQMDGLGGQFAALGERLSGLSGPFADALGTLTSTGGGITQTFKNILQAKGEFTQGVEGIRALAADATQAIDRGLGALQSFADLSGIALDIKSLIYDTKSVYGNLRCLLNEVKAKGLYVYTGIVGSATCAGLYGQPVSPLIDTVNTFDTITQSQQQAIIGQATANVTTNAQNASAKIQQFDVPIMLANGGS
jgi:hypothetical protein